MHTILILIIPHIIVQLLPVLALQLHTLTPTLWILVQILTEIGQRRDLDLTTSMEIPYILVISVQLVVGLLVKLLQFHLVLFHLTKSA